MSQIIQKQVTWLTSQSYPVSGSWVMRQDTEFSYQAYFISGCMTRGYHVFNNQFTCG